MPKWLSIIFAVMCLGSEGCATDRLDAIQLFNGADLDGWVVHTTEAGYENPGLFTIVDGMLKIAGGAGDTAYYGGLITKESFSNYRLVIEYKWGGPTYGDRRGKARDSGLLVHAVGPVEPGPWMTSYECQIIEGGTGDILIVNDLQSGLYTLDDSNHRVTLSLTAELQKRGGQSYFAAGSPYLVMNGGIQRLNWWGRDPEWKDVSGFRGAADIESQLGEWTRVDIDCTGDHMTIRVNGTLVNSVEGLTLKGGRIFLQSEGAEMWVRKLELHPLDADNRRNP